MPANPIQYLKKGKALCGKVFGSFVETFNWHNDFCKNLCGDADIPGNENGKITVSRSDPSAPVIRCSGCGGSSSKSADVDEQSISKEDEKICIMDFASADTSESPIKSPEASDGTSKIEWLKMPQPDGNTIEWVDDYHYGTGKMYEGERHRNKICLSGSFYAANFGKVPYLASEGVLSWRALPWTANVESFDDYTINGQWMNPFVIVANQTVRANPADVFAGENYLIVDLENRTAQVSGTEQANTDRFKCIYVGKILDGIQTEGIYTTPNIFAYE